MRKKLLFGWTLLIRVCMAGNPWTVLCQLMSPLSVAATADYGQHITYEKYPSLRVLIIKNFVGMGPLGAMVDGAKERWREALKSMRNGQQWAELFDLNEQCFKQLMKYNVFLTLKDINCDFHKGGFVSVARNLPQAQRQRSAVELARERGT